MSAIADFRMIETSALEELRNQAVVRFEKKLFSKKRIDNYWSYLNAHSKELKDFDGSGYVFADLLVFLKESKGIDLLTGEFEEVANAISADRQNSTIIFTFDHKQKYLKDMAPEKFTLEELIAFNKDFSEDDDPAPAAAELNGIKTLYNHLDLLTSSHQVILLSVI